MLEVQNLFYYGIWLATGIVLMPVVGLMLVEIRETFAKDKERTDEL